MCRPMIVALLLCAAALAQQPAPAPQVAQPAAPGQPASREDVIRLFKALRVEKTMELVQANIKATLEQVLRESIERHKADLTPERARLEAFRERSRERAAKMYPIGEMLNDFIPVYQKHFSKADIDGVVAFFESPVGQRLLDKQPELMQEGMALLTPKLQQRMREFDAEMKRDAEETLAADKDKESTPEPPKKP